MQSNINEILKAIEALQKDLRREYEKLIEKYQYKIENGKITFLDSIHSQNVQFKQNLFKYILTADFKHLISIPIIYSMIIPMIFLDIFLWIYQTLAFPLYGVSKVKRSDYIVQDRQYLDFLNILQKVNCIYCTYANGLFAYAVEIAARTERYWCPIKSAHQMKHAHRFYSQFADYGDAKGFYEIFNKIENPADKSTPGHREHKD